MKRLLVLLLVLYSIGSSCCFARPSGPPPPSSSGHHKDDKRRLPPPPPPPYVVSRDTVASETPFNACNRHFLVQETTTLYYSDGTTSSSSIYHVRDYRGNYIVQNCRAVEHISYNENHYLLLRLSTYKYKLLNADAQRQSYDIEYSKLTQIGENRLLAQKNGKYGIIDLEQREIVPIKYKSIKKLGDNIYQTKLNGYYGIVSIDGREIVPCNCDKISDMGGYYKIKREKKYGIMDNKGNILATIIYKKVKLERNKIMVTRDGSTWSYIKTWY